MMIDVATRQVVDLLTDQVGSRSPPCAVRSGWETHLPNSKTAKSNNQQRSALWQQLSVACAGPGRDSRLCAAEQEGQGWRGNDGQAHEHWYSLSALRGCAVRCAGQATRD
eukprot:507154-Rhodomonas_salina.2